MQRLLLSILLLFTFTFSLSAQSDSVRLADVMKAYAEWDPQDDGLMWSAPDAKSTAVEVTELRALKDSRRGCD